MNEKEAKQLLEEVFHDSFDEKRYLTFITEFLNGKIDIDKKPAIWASSTFKDYIVNSKCLGTYKDTNKKTIAIVTVELKKTSSVEKARTIQRNFIANYLNKSGLDAAIIAFYGDDGDDWRLSFVKLEYKNVNIGNKLKSETELTPVKRYSYLVGKHEANHTCKSQLSPILQDDKLDTTLEEIEKAFSVDKVTKEFFDRYKELFFRLNESLKELMEKDRKIKKEFDEKDIKPDEFSKKLLGQIVFLFFLQKKGWMGIQKDKEGDFENWGTGPKDFLQKLYNKKYLDYNNFFNDILEPLFYEALAKDRRDNSNYYSKLKCKIPFLNGGLFEPINDYSWEKTDILIDNDIFKEILDVFSQYNFTVKEDEPLEKEVAVDPEMLGKVFENLLEIRDRKSKGSYYTPREIVHYMCQQSLINYLETNLESEKVPKEDIESFILNGDLTLAELIKEQEEKKQGITYATSKRNYELPDLIKKNFKKIDALLKEVKIADPAVGSGAFPVGMMNEIVKARSIISALCSKKEQEERTNYNLKRETIENSLYGVDIDPAAVEISKLRFWLSLIVDEDDIDNIKPLPNLDNKIMCGNSLLDSFEGVTLYNHPEAGNTYQLKLFDNKADVSFKKLQKLQKEYFNEEDRFKKKAIFKQIEDIEWDFIEEKLKEQKSQDALNKLQQIKRNRSRPFFIWELYFSDVFNRQNPGFDIMITNPPYVGEKSNKEMFRLIVQSKFGKRFYQGKMDLFYFFFHKAIDLGRNKCQIAFITTNYYLTAKYAKKLRCDLKERTIIRKLINFNELKIFESARGQHNIITILSKNINLEYLTNTCITQRIGIANREILYNVLYNKDEKTDYFSITQKELYDGENNYIRLFGNTSNPKNARDRVLFKLSNSDKILKEICYINSGIQTGCDRINDSLGSKGVFILNKSEYKQIPKKEQVLLKPFFKNSDIKKYWCSKNTEYRVIYIDRNFRDSSKFPELISHLNNFKYKLNEIREVKNGTIKYYQLQWPREEHIFTDAKIIVPQRSKYNTFGYNEFPWYASVDVYFITKKEESIKLKYILSLLNSKLYYFWLYYMGKKKGDTLELYQQPLSEIPIKQISSEKQKPFIQLVDKILSITKDEDYLENKSKQQKVKQLEAEIDQLVYKLYELTPEEIKIVEDILK